MTTQFEIDCALMAGLAYQTTRDRTNWFPTPEGWQQFSHVPNSTYLTNSGFEAVSFQNSVTGEIVISYAGTFDKDISGDVAADLALGAGLGSSQLIQAAEYYMKVKADNASGTATPHITFTGHSLGGGLASLMAVFFDETAMTFDQAPFRNSANWMIATALKLDLVSKFPVAAYPQISTWLAPLDRFILSFDPLGVGWSQDGLNAREAKVTNLSMQGEFLSATPALRIGTELSPLSHGDYFAPLNLHSQALLSAFLQSEQTASANATTNIKETLGQVTFKLTDLLRMFFDEKLFAYTTDPTNTTDDNFLERLVRHEAGIRDPLTRAVITPDDAMLTRFTSDLWKLAQDGGLTLNDGSGLSTTYSNWNNVSKALIAFAMQMYYENTTNATDKDKQLFKTITGGVQFDIFDVSKTFQAEFDEKGEIDLNDAKGYKEYFAKYLSDNPHVFFTPEERGQIAAFLPKLRDWTVQAGAGGMTATDTQNRGAFMLGGNGADTLTGGSADDLLVGNAGADILSGEGGNDILLGCAGDDTLKGGDGADLLIGGADNDTLDGGTGNDLLKGGEGNDTYTFTGNYGTDLIADSDGSGRIQVDGQTVGNATLTSESIYQDSASGQTIVKLNSGHSLVILKEGTANHILVNDWSTARSLGVSLQDTTLPTPQATLIGDFKKAYDNDGKYVMDGNGNYTKDGAQANALDLISGTTGKDVIDGLGGDDALSGLDGDDWIEGGDGNDHIQGGLGKDTLNGGIGDDAIYGSSDMAISKPTRTDFTQPVNTYLHPQATGFNWTAGYTDTFTNGVPQGYSNAPRNRLPGDKGNVIDGGARAMLRSTPKKCQKPIPSGRHACWAMAANDRAYSSERSAA